MDQLPVPIIELVMLVLYLGSVTFIFGMVYQIYILWKNKKSFSEYVFILVFTRFLSIITAFLIWGYLPFVNKGTIFIFFVPAIISEIIWSPAILKLFNNNL